MYITDAMRGNNKKVVEDCVEAYKDYTGTVRLYRHQRGCAEELELVMICTRLHKSLWGYANSSKVIP